jgi:hypothetical protein
MGDARARKSGQVIESRLLRFYPEIFTKGNEGNKGFGKQVQLCRFFAILVSFCKSILIRSARASGCLAEVIQWIQSRRAIGVTSDHNARATGLKFQLAPAANSRQQEGI